MQQREKCVIVSILVFAVQIGSERKQTHSISLQVIQTHLLKY